MAAETGCDIEINTMCKDPHFVIYGDVVDDVEECARQISKSLKSAKERHENKENYSRGR